MTPRIWTGVLCAAALSASCNSSAFMNLDPWPGSVREQQSDAWLSGGRYGQGAIVASDVPAYDGDGDAGASTDGQERDPALGGLEPAPPGEEPLLTWDGDVIDGPKRGEVVEREDPARGLEPNPGGRTYLLQLYQDVIDERDHLEDEVRALRKALGEAQAQLDDHSASTTGLSTRLDALDAEVERLAAENEDLAARLATAQIRRLEAEKLLLEARIDWYRTLEGEDATTGSELGPDGSPISAGSDTRRRP